ncbi:NAD(P)-dependent alcohol dehydrogenase [Demequina sp. SO4-13]|uniref:NAD(P)-dependent alcohol dehydrogenase n=1 Tax=Demequina sp. SO4-13 TaxID=3401027 RepID=UPI003AF44C58
MTTDQASAPHPHTLDQVTMRAAVQRRYAGPEHISLATVPRPSVRPDQVLIEVHAAGVERGAWHLATGQPLVMRALGFGLRRPRQPIVGTEVAGIVVEIGEAVTRFAVGDAIMGAADGAYAEWAVAKESAVTLKPADISFDEASAVGVSGLAALVAIERAHLRPEQRVLVLGASGGVGSFATQLAAAAGAHVTGVSSAAKAEFVANLGADAVIDYRTTEVTAARHSFDVIIDAGGLTPLWRLRRILAPEGTLVIVGGEGGGRITGGAGRQLRAVFASLVTRRTLTSILSTTNADGLQRLCAHITAGDVRAAVTTSYPLERASEALVDLGAGRIAGKAIITVR